MAWAWECLTGLSVHRGISQLRCLAFTLGVAYQGGRQER